MDNVENVKIKKKYTYSKEKIQEYNNKFMEKHKEPIECPICFCKYKYHQKYNHQKTRIHQNAEKIISKLNNKL
jgi:hypothetical protein